MPMQRSTITDWGKPTLASFTRLVSSRRVPPGTYSIARKKPSPAVSTVSTSTMLRWARSAVSRASLINASVRSSDSEPLSSLIATFFLNPPTPIMVASHTSAAAPSPRRFVSS